MLATAESCTGGMLGAALTARAGSSDVFERGFITYSYESKTEILGVPASTIKKHGAVSAQTAKAMAEGALTHSRADVAVAITGIAGPGGGMPGKPVGLVYIGYGTKDGITTAEHHFTGDRDFVREQTCRAALEHLCKLVDSLP